MQNFRFRIWLTERIMDRPPLQERLARGTMGLGSWLILGLVLLLFTGGLYLYREHRWAKELETALVLDWAETVQVGTPAGKMTTLTVEERAHLTQYLGGLTHSDSRSGNFSTYLGKTVLNLYLTGPDRYQVMVVSENGCLQCDIGTDYHLFTGAEELYQYLHSVWRE